MKKSEMDQLINYMLTHAKEGYKSDQYFNDQVVDTQNKLKNNPEFLYPESQTELMECYKLLNDPGYIKEKTLALNVCQALIQSSLGSGGLKEGSIMHLLGLRLYDYIDRLAKDDG